MNRVGAIKKACDQCNRRRVKCDGQLPCRTCVKGYVECTFVKPVLKKGPAPNPEGRRRRRKQQQQSLSDAGSADDTSLTETYSDCLNPSIFCEYKALRDIPRGDSPSQPFPNPPSYIISSAHDQTKETDQYDAGPSFSSNNQYDPFQLVTAPPVAPLDLLVAMPCDNSKWEELFAQKVSSRPASPFKLLDVGPFSDVSFGGARGGMQQPGWVVTEPWNTLAGGVPMIGGMHRNDGSALTIPCAPTGQLVPNEKDWSPMFAVCLDSLIRPQIDIFFSRIAPMIPVFTAQYIRAKLCGPCHDKDFVGMVLAMTALSLVHPLNVEESRQRQTRVKQAQILMDEALRLRDGWQFGSTATVESIMTSYLMFGTLYEMGYAAGAKLRLREAVSLGETMGLHDPRSYLGLGRAEVLRRLKTYWVLSVTERAYSLQHLSGIIFEGPISTLQILPPKNLADINDDDDGTSPSLRYLAQLFSFIDQDIVTCWNGRCDGPSCRCLSEKRAIDILSKLGGSPTEVFGVDFEIQLRNLAESQRADLLITWQWLRNRIWRLAFLHGLARENGPVELSRVYLANVAIAALDICRDLSTRSMDAHGAGFVSAPVLSCRVFNALKPHLPCRQMQKLYDIASAIPELLRHDFVCEPRMFTPAQTAHLSQIVRQLYGHVARYRAGNSEFVQPLAEAITLASLTVIQE
ncbi:hypothetical protein QFC21_004639 [Naganishia friedmannii]|uniref:Uncharacterized protein n=1 Tax=Naganishia friedmannii TaxID=89922 RepID=A0ACC2VFA4_9TREE|nr:hypothetical protein QFC21_004639 [Naganishia friedmannii]